MSLMRLIIWSSLIGGLAAFFGLFFSEMSVRITYLSVKNFARALVILKEAWITVEAGFRPGRQIILGKDLITMGTSEKSSLIFIAFGAKGVEPTHLKITKQNDGRYLLEDNQSRSGTLLNGQP